MVLTMKQLEISYVIMKVLQFFSILVALQQDCLCFLTFETNLYRYARTQQEEERKGHH
jgi:hypothetical protein